MRDIFHGQGARGNPILGEPRRSNPNGDGERSDDQTGQDFRRPEKVANRLSIVRSCRETGHLSNQRGGHAEIEQGKPGLQNGEDAYQAVRFDSEICM